MIYLQEQHIYYRGCSIHSFMDNFGEFFQDEIIKKRQLFATQITVKTLIQTKTFLFGKYEIFSNLLLLFGKLDNIDSVIIPVFHDWHLSTEELREFTESFPELKKFIAMCAPDGSCIFYTLNTFDWDDLDSNDENPDSD